MIAAGFDSDGGAQTAKNADQGDRVAAEYVDGLELWFSTRRQTLSTTPYFNHMVWPRGML